VDSFIRAGYIVVDGEHLLTDADASSGSGSNGVMLFSLVLFMKKVAIWISNKFDINGW